MVLKLVLILARGWGGSVRLAAGISPEEDSSSTSGQGSLGKVAGLAGLSRKSAMEFAKGTSDFAKQLS